MPDLDSAIRERLAWRVEGADPNDLDAVIVKELVGALSAVLDVHHPEPETGPFAHSYCRECHEGGPGYEAEQVPYPCPTVLAIADKLGIYTPPSPAPDQP
jgi:hypothetical protein